MTEKLEVLKKVFDFLKTNDMGKLKNIILQLKEKNLDLSEIKEIIGDGNILDSLKDVNLGSLAGGLLGKVGLNQNNSNNNELDSLKNQITNLIQKEESNNFSDILKTFLNNL